MRSYRWLSLVLLSLLALGGCAGGPKKRVFPPQARIHELLVDAERWRVKLRVHNFSTVPMTFASIDAALSVDGIDAGRVSITTPVDVVASSVEVVETTLAPPAAVRDAVARALADGRSVEYRLDGAIRSSEPRGNWPFEFSSRLDRVPGLERVLR